MNRKEWNEHAATFEKNVCDIAREETDDQLSSFVSRARFLRENAVLVDMGCGIGTFIQKFGHRFGWSSWNIKRRRRSKRRLSTRTVWWNVTALIRSILRAMN
jgi:hypothetical protein